MQTVIYANRSLLYLYCYLSECSLSANNVRQWQLSAQQSLCTPLIITYLLKCVTSYTHVLKTNLKFWMTLLFELRMLENSFTTFSGVKQRKFVLYAANSETLSYKKLCYPLITTLGYFFPVGDDDMFPSPIPLNRSGQDGGGEVSVHCSQR